MNLYLAYYQITRAFLDDGLLDIPVVREIPPSKLLSAVRELQVLSPEGRYIS
jgi:hypothetical protein